MIEIIFQDAYIADKDLPENQDIKSNKQRKKDKWFQGMVDKKKGCKKCGFVFCRCYGWEFKPSHVKWYRIYLVFENWNKTEIT